MCQSVSLAGFLVVVPVKGVMLLFLGMPNLSNVATMLRTLERV
jgi:hypothetical protein